MQTTQKGKGAVAVTQHTPTNHDVNCTRLAGA